MTEHTHKQFDAEMEAIRSGVLAMGGLVEKQLGRALDALGDEEVGDLIDAVGADEQAINRMQMEIDQQCTQIIAKRQPAAIDLQDDHDRDESGQRSRADRRRSQEDRVQGGAGGRQRSPRADALARRDARAGVGADHAAIGARRVRPARYRAAAEVVSEDETVDASFHAIMRQLISYMMEDPRTITAALEIVFIAKSIERVGDHAKNIAEAVVQAVKGIDVRHASADQIRAELSEP